jgi:hypothetical protein
LESFEARLLPDLPCLGSYSHSFSFGHDGTVPQGKISYSIIQRHHLDPQPVPALKQLGTKEGNASHAKAGMYLWSPGFSPNLIPTPFQVPFSCFSYY